MSKSTKDPQTINRRVGMVDPWDGQLYSDKGHAFSTPLRWIQFPEKISPASIWHPEGPAELLLRTARSWGWNMDIVLAGMAGDEYLGTITGGPRGEVIGVVNLGVLAGKVVLQGMPVAAEFLKEEFERFDRDSREG